MNEPDIAGGMPRGFSLVTGKDGVVTILHKRTGMGCMNVFLMVWLVGWTAGCVFVLYAYFHGAEMDDGGPMPFWFAAVFWGFEIMAVTIIIPLLFAKKSFRLTSRDLIVETRLLGLTSRRTFLRERVARLVQVKDGGVGKDSFPSWGLRLKGKQEAALIRRQPYEVSHWLGRVLAEWAGVEFRPAPKKK